MKSDIKLGWQTLSSKQIFEHKPWIDLSVETIKTSDGQIVDDFYQLAVPDFSIIFASTDDGHVVVIRQYKHGARQVSLTLPGGLIETAESPFEAAQRELLEETGYQAESWEALGTYVISANLGCGLAHVYRASGAHFVQNPNSGDLEEMEILLLKKSDLGAAVNDGRVVLMTHAAVILMALSA